MEDMTLEEGWIASALKEKTQYKRKRSLSSFKEFLGISDTDKIIELRKNERNFETRIVLYFKWLQEKRKLNQNSAISYIVPIQSLFSYAGIPLKLKNKIPKFSIKIEKYRPTLEDLQKLFKFGDLQLKAWLSLVRCCVE